MQFLVICRPAAGGDPDKFKRLVPLETQALREQKAKGAVTGAWTPGHPGAILMLEVADETEAARVVATFPWPRPASSPPRSPPCTPST
jgi:hypothetical protein